MIPMEPVSNADKLRDKAPEDIDDVLSELEDLSKFWKEAMREQAEEYIESLQSIQQERDKLLRKLNYKDLIISNAVELVEDREKVLSELRPFVSPEHQKLIDSVVDNGSFNVGVGEERT
jgi:SMC interacting uncharacterized protein involved in chromosome segregation